MKNKQKEFLKLVQEFIEGKDRSKNQVQIIEGCFAELYDRDENFEDLQYALSMFGYGNSQEDEIWLINEFQYALALINESENK